MDHNTRRAVDDMSALFEDGRDRGWMDYAACAGHPNPDLWSPDTSNLYARETRIAATICSKCPVRNECFNFGRNERFGIYGGVLMPAGRPIPVLEEPIAAQIKIPSRRPEIRQPQARRTPPAVPAVTPEPEPAMMVVRAAELPTDTEAAPPSQPVVREPEQVSQPEPPREPAREPVAAAPVEERHGIKLPGSGVLKKLGRWFR
jgi:Transcription factor WhiB